MPTTLHARAMAMLVRPHAEWVAVAREQDDVAHLYLRYIVPLAAIGPLAFILRFRSVGWVVLGLVQYALQLAALYVCARIVGMLAPRFRSDGNTVQALKLVAYSATPAWVASALNVLPIPNVVVTLAVLYSVYLYYLGLSPVLRTPPEQVVPFTLVSAIVTIVGFTLVSAMVGTLVGAAIGVLRL